LISSCNWNKKTSKSEASLRLNWLTTCSFAGEVVGAEKFAEENSLKLKLDKGGPGLDPIKLVESGVNTFGVAGADLVLSANDKGGDFVIIGLVNYNSPGVWVSKAEKNIKVC
jgi:NitT/TauT family transport system substrate-binding protein